MEAPLLSISLWVKINDFSNVLNNIIGDANSHIGRFIMGMTTSGNAYVSTGNDGSLVITTSSNSVSGGSWAHCVFVYRGVNQIQDVYLNCVKTSSTAGSTNTISKIVLGVRSLGDYTQKINRLNRPSKNIQQSINTNRSNSTI